MHLFSHMLDIGIPNELGGPGFEYGCTHPDWDVVEDDDLSFAQQVANEAQRMLDGGLMRRVIPID